MKVFFMNHFGNILLWLQLGNWELAVGDYEILRKETPEDDQVIRGLMEAQNHLVKRRGHENL